MAETEDQYIPDTRIEREKEHAIATDAQMRRTSDHAAIDDVTPLATDELEVPSSTYIEAEAVANSAAVNDLLAAVAEAQGKLNEVLDVLRDAQLVPVSE